MGWFSDFFAPIQDAWKDVWHGIQDIPIVGDALTGVQESITRPIYDYTSDAVTNLGNTLEKTKIDNYIATLAGFPEYNLLEAGINKDPEQLLTAALPYAAEIPGVSDAISGVKSTVGDWFYNAADQLSGLGYDFVDKFNLNSLFDNFGGTPTSLNPYGMEYGMNMPIPGSDNSLASIDQGSGVGVTGYGGIGSSGGSNIAAGGGSDLTNTGTYGLSNPDYSGYTTGNPDELQGFRNTTPSWANNVSDTSGVTRSMPTLEGMGQQSNGDFFGGMKQSGVSPNVGIGGDASVQGNVNYGAKNMGIGDWIDKGWDYVEKNPMDVLGGLGKLYAGYKSDQRADERVKMLQDMQNRALSTSDPFASDRALASNKWQAMVNDPSAGWDAHAAGLGPELQAAAAKMASGGRRNMLPTLLSQAKQNYMGNAKNRLAAYNPAQFGAGNTSGVYSSFAPALSSAMGQQGGGIPMALGDIFNNYQNGQFRNKVLDAINRNRTVSV